MGYGYQQAIDKCVLNGEVLIKIANLQEALDLYYSSPLNLGFRLDAVSNETCFKDQMGQDVDPEQHGFSNDIMQPESFFGLSADEGGQISLVNDSDVLLTVWQFSDGEDEVDHEMEVKYGIISNVSKR